MSRVVDLGALGSGGFTVQGAAAGDLAGMSVSAVGDFNGDGFGDFIVGAPLNDSGGSYSGAAYLIYGHAGGFAGIDLANLQPAQGFRIQGDSANDHAGLSVSGAGDVNGDGFDDLLVGAVGHGMLGYGFNLEAYLIFGRAAKPAGIDLTGLSASDGVSISSNIGTGYTGHVASAGDINGDGFADVLLGSPYDLNSRGAAYVIFGGNTIPGQIDATNPGSHGFVITAGTELFHVGGNVADAGDVNGDGFDDMLVTAQSSGFNFYGSVPHAYVIFGKESASANVDLSNLSPSDGFVINGTNAYYASDFSVAGAGDVNGDGFADIIFGSTYDNGYAGAAYVVFGKAQGLGSVNLANLAPSSGFVIHGIDAGDLAGISVASAGDVNGDGYDDIIIGAESADGDADTAGAAYLIFGKPGGFTNIDLADLPQSVGVAIHGISTFDQTGLSVSGGVDLNGDGYDDVIIAAPYQDAGGTDAGEAFVLFGSPTLQRHPTDDFNGDGRSDILWRNDDGRLVDWLGTASGGFTGSGSGSTVPVDWQVAGTGDFNGDGRADILWRSASSGAVADWLGTPSGGFVGNGAHFHASVAASWQVAGIGDFNGDGRSDVLWMNDDGRLVDWLGTTAGGFASNGAHSANTISAGWEVAGIGDFNGDGRSDILWRNADGRVADWLGTASGGFAGNGGNSRSAVSTDWQVAAIGDFNGDGRSDILWRHTDGRIADWLGTVTGGFIGNGANSAAAVSTQWEVATTGDYNGDGTDDILWRNPSTGEMTNWLGDASGGFVDNSAHAGHTVETQWHVQAIDYLG
jgi:hypothetical protein